MKRIIIYGLLICLMIITGIETANAQECKVQKANTDGSYSIIIGGIAYRAITSEQQKMILDKDQKLNAANLKIEELKAEIESRKKIQEAKDTQINDLNALVAKNKEYSEKLEIANKKCEDVVNAIGGGRKFTLDGAIGATGSNFDYKPALMIGAGYSIFRVWGFVQSGNTGILAGVSYPLF